MPAPRLLLLTVDRLPAWILPAWGATWVSAPAIDRLAAEGLVLDRAFATSLDPRRTLEALAGGLPAAARAAGLDAALVTDDPELPQRESCGEGVLPLPLPRRRAREPAQTALGRLFDAARAAVARGHRIVWVHAASPGIVWDAPEGFDEPYVDSEDPAPPAGVTPPSLPVDDDTDPDVVVGWRQRVAGQVSLLDRLVGELVALLPDGPAEPWAICLAGIRGLPLGLHGWVGLPATEDAERPFAESIHVPVILVDPGRRMAGQRYPGLVTPTDVGATLRGFAGLAAAPSGDDPGRSLEGLFDTWTHEPRDRVICAAAGGVAVVTPAWHWVEVPGSAPGDEPHGRLYAQPDDFFEFCDVADRCPDVGAGLAGIAALARAGRTVEARETALP